SRPVSSFAHARPSAIHTLSLHDALPISSMGTQALTVRSASNMRWRSTQRSRTTGNLLMGSRVMVLSSVSATSVSISAEQLCRTRSEEHTSELQSRENLVCRLLLEKKKKK